MKINADILQILSTLETDGPNARIVGQLNRKFYLAVDKILQAAGGKWNRKAKAHVFAGDAAEILDPIITCGEVTTSRELGFFVTPSPVIQILMDLADIKADDVVLEPSAGTGALVDAIIATGASVTMVEYDMNRRQVLRDKYPHVPLVQVPDFLDTIPTFEFTKVVMNPPFTRVGKGDHLDHVQHAFRFLKPGGRLVTVLPSSIIFRQDKRYKAFRAWYECYNGVVQDLPSQSFHMSGTDVNTVVLSMVA